MNLQPLPTQLSGALFLANSDSALLADEPRVGKTGTAIIAADYRFASPVLVITTASGRGVWRRGWAEWSAFGRKVQVLTPKDRLLPDTDVAIVGWPSIGDPKLRHQLLARRWALLISDEDHYAKNFGAKRTQALYGELIDDGALLQNRLALYAVADAVWPLTGTPAPNSPLDTYPRLRALAPRRLEADPARGWPDVRRLGDFTKRYVITRPMKIGRGAYARRIDVVVGGRNEAELAARMDGFMLRRTQADVGIRAPIYEIFPLIVSERARREVEAGVDTRAVLAAAERGDTKSLDMHMGPLRRLTGAIKAKAVIEAVGDEMACGLDKIVLAYWHRDVGDALRAGLAKHGVVGIDGATPPAQRAAAEARFRDDPGTGVFLAQIVAAGEAIDLSAAAELLFVETSFVPKDQKQMALRITNHTQTRQARVRVAALDGSIDEAAQRSLLRKWTSIREVLR